MTTKILKIIPMPDNTEIHLAEILLGFSVTLFDNDTKQPIGGNKIYKEINKAKNYMESLKKLILKGDN